MQIIDIKIDLCRCYEVNKEFVNLAAQKAEGVGWGEAWTATHHAHRPPGDATVSILPLVKKIHIAVTQPDRLRKYNYKNSSAFVICTSFNV